MKPYDKSNSFMRRVTKRVSDFIPGTAWMNVLLGKSQSGDDSTLSTENEDQPPMKKMCTSNNTFLNNRMCVDTNPSVNSIENHRNSHVHLPELSAISCAPSTSSQSTMFASQSNSSSLGHDIGNRSSLKRKSDVADLSNIHRLNPKTPTLYFASSTLTSDALSKSPVSISSKRSLHSSKLSTFNDFSPSTSSKLIKPNEKESPSITKFYETTNNLSLPSFRWDTFVNYGELSERQKLFAQKSPLNCSRVMYGGRSAHSNLSKILGNTPPLHKKTVIPISPSINNEFRTTSSIILECIATKDKEIEENKFIIQPKMDGHLRHKANKKIVPIKIETTVKVIDDTTLKISEEKSDDTSLNNNGRDISRKLRANISKKARGLKPDEHEMPEKLDLPDISLPMFVLPNINLSNNEVEDHEFTFNQPLTLEEFGLQIVEKSSRKKQQMAYKKSQSIDTIPSKKNHQSPSTVLSPSCDTFKKPSENVSTLKNDFEIKNAYKSDKVSEFDSDLKDVRNTPLDNFGCKVDFAKPENKIFDNSFQVLESNHKKQTSNKLPVEHKKWTSDTSLVSNDPDKTKYVACQTSKSNDTSKPSIVSESVKWTCDTCWVPNKSETDQCVACQTPKPGSTKKVVEKCSTWNCDACWVNNKSEYSSCIACNTAKPGSAPAKSQPSTQFDFGLNNSSLEKSGSSQFKFGFVGGNTDQIKFGSSTFKTSENKNSDVSTTEYKFGLTNSESDKPLDTFKFGIDSAISQPITKPVEISLNKDTDKPSNQFKFGVENKLDHPESQLKFLTNATSNKPIAQFNLSSVDSETIKSVQQNVATYYNKFEQSRPKFLVTNEKSEVSPNRSEFKFGDTKQVEISSPRVTFGSIETNCSNSSVESKNEDLSIGKFVKDKKNVEIKPVINSKIPSTIQSQDVNSVRLINGHSHTNELSNEESKSDLIKTSQLFSFGSLAQQDQNLPDDHKKPVTFTFGSATNENKLFATPVLGATFSNTGPVFGASTSIFSSGPNISTSATLSSSTTTPKFSFGQFAPSTLGNIFKDEDKNPSTSTSVVLGQSVSTPKFTFGSMASPTLNNFTKVNDKNSFPQTSNSLVSTTNVGFSFGAQSPSVFSVSNTDGFKTSVQANDQTKDASNSIFSVKQTVKLDPNAPISINFTGGATTQFTAKPETTEPPTKRKILKPVRRIR